MKITETKTNNALTLNISGRLDTSNYRDAEAKFNELITNGEHKIAVNLEGLEYISSAGLRVFLLAMKKIKAQNGKLVLFEVSEKVLEIFTMSGFDKFLMIKESQEDALGVL